MPALRTVGFNRASFPAFNPGTTQTVAIGAASAASAAIGSPLVRLVATVACYVAFGSTPTATATSMYLPAGMPEYFVVNESDEVAVLEAASAGTLFVTPATMTP